MKKDPKIFLKLMEEHDENENWFSSLIGFFYEHDLSNDSISTIGKYNHYSSSTSTIYLSSINGYNENKKLTSMYQLLNIIIAKYLLSFHY